MALKVFRLDLPPEQTADLAAALEDVVSQQPRHPTLGRRARRRCRRQTVVSRAGDIVGDPLDAVIRQSGRRADRRHARDVESSGRSARSRGRRRHPPWRAAPARRADGRRGAAADRRRRRAGLAKGRRTRASPASVFRAGACRGSPVGWPGRHLCARRYCVRTGYRATHCRTRQRRRCWAETVPGADVNALSDVFSRALAIEPGARFGSASDLVDALRPILARTQTAPSTMALPPELPKASVPVETEPAAIESAPEIHDSHDTIQDDEPLPSFLAPADAHDYSVTEDLVTTIFPPDLPLIAGAGAAPLFEVAADDRPGVVPGPRGNAPARRACETVPRCRDAVAVPAGRTCRGGESLSQRDRTDPDRSDVGAAGRLGSRAPPVSCADHRARRWRRRRVRLGLLDGVAHRRARNGSRRESRRASAALHRVAASAAHAAHRRAASAGRKQAPAAFTASTPPGFSAARSVCAGR